MRARSFTKFSVFILIVNIFAIFSPRAREFLPYSAPAAASPKHFPCKFKQASKFMIVVAVTPPKQPYNIRQYKLAKEQ
ncbi:hypothetical protein JT31_13890 [Cedecea neteri]|uniref:Uncharacterized protein n=1 Tax=Cedecea neteri TaxID=158822 RepID=A0A089Q335_9ENTR|nr:hypothetical protein JT31_13890 [Cedecea neteri]